MSEICCICFKEMSFDSLRALTNDANQLSACQMRRHCDDCLEIRSSCCFTHEWFR